MSMPLSSGSVSSSSVMPGAAAAEERRERLLEVRVDGRERLAEARVRRLVDAPDGLVGLRDRVDEVLALRRQEGVARVELVELLDGHHVDRAELVDLAAQLGDGLFGGHRAGRGRRRSSRLRRASADRPRIGRGLDRLRPRLHRHPAPPRRGSRATSGSMSPAASIRSTSARTSSSGTATASRHCCARCVEVGFGGRARDVELGGQRAHGVERAARVADDLFLLLGRRLELRPPARRPRACRRAGPRARATSSSISRWPSATAASSRSR